MSEERISDICLKLAELRRNHYGLPVQRSEDALVDSGEVTLRGIPIKWIPTMEEEE